MKKLLLALGLAAALGVPALAQAREVTFATELNKYAGDGAYLAIYVTDAAGKYHRTLWVAGEKSKYYKHLSGWARGSGLNPAEYDGLTGASVTAGRADTAAGLACLQRWKNSSATAGPDPLGDPDPGPYCGPTAAAGTVTTASASAATLAALSPCRWPIK